MFVKRSMGRLGAAVGVVALLAGGLVGVAAPAHAEPLGDDEVLLFEKCGKEKYWLTVYYGPVQNAEPSLKSECETDNLFVYKGYRTLKVINAGTEGEQHTLQAYGEPVLDNSGGAQTEPVQKTPPPPPCWDASINNCPVGGALRFTAPKYAMVGVPVTMYAYASWRPDGNAPSQPTNGTAVIRVDGEDYSGVEFVDGVAEWRFIPETEGMKEFTASGVVFSGLSGANAYIDTVPARTYVLEYDPAAYATALKNKRVEVGDTYVVTDPNQARSYLEDRYEWSVSEKSDDVCAVYETKKGAVKAKFNGEGKCTVIWMDKESEEEGKYTFIAKK